MRYNFTLTTKGVRCYPNVQLNRVHIYEHRGPICLQGDCYKCTLSVPLFNLNFSLILIYALSTCTVGKRLTLATRIIFPTRNICVRPIIQMNMKSIFNIFPGSSTVSGKKMVSLSGVAHRCKI